MSISLVHVASPEGGVFSQRKKQCDLWEFVWGTSVLLCRLLRKLEPVFSGAQCSVLEVGCGSALCSLVCAMSGATRVVATDAVEDAVRVAEISREANGIGPGIMEFKRASWESVGSYEEDAFDVVVGSDILFGRWCAEPVSRVVERCMKRGGLAIIADPVRLNMEEFIERVEMKGMVVDVRRFTESEMESVVREVGGLADDSKPFVKLKKAKVCIIRWKTERDGEPFLSDVSKGVLKIVMDNTVLCEED